MSRKHGELRRTTTKLPPSSSICLEATDRSGQTIKSAGLKSDGASRGSGGGAEPDMEDRWDGSRDRWED